MGQERSTDLAFISRREEFERREAVHFDGLDLVGRGVHLGDDDVGALRVLLAELVPDGRQLFAVAAPWRVWNHGGMGRVNTELQVCGPLKTGPITNSP